MPTRWCSVERCASGCDSVSCIGTRFEVCVCVFVNYLYRTLIPPGTGADPFGMATLKRAWDDGTDTVANAERRMDVAFEFFTRLGVDYYTFHDRCVQPQLNYPTVCICSQ